MIAAARSSVRLRLGVAVALVVTVAVAVVTALAGPAGAGSGALAWQGKVEVFDTGIPTDKVLYSRLSNTSLRDVSLDVDDARALDEDGREVRSSVVFLAAFAHGIFPYDSKLTDFERRRLGQIATLKPGQAVPVTFAWRVRQGGKPPVRLDFGAVEVAVPASASASASGRR